MTSPVWYCFFGSIKCTITESDLAPLFNHLKIQRLLKHKVTELSVEDGLKKSLGLVF